MEVFSKLMFFTFFELQYKYKMKLCEMHSTSPVSEHFQLNSSFKPKWYLQTPYSYFVKQIANHKHNLPTSKSFCCFSFWFILACRGPTLQSGMEFQIGEELLAQEKKNRTSPLSDVWVAKRDKSDRTTNFCSWFNMVPSDGIFPFSFSSFFFFSFSLSSYFFFFRFLFFSFLFFSFLFSSFLFFSFLFFSFLFFSFLFFSFLFFSFLFFSFLFFSFFFSFLFSFFFFFSFLF